MVLTYLKLPLQRFLSKYYPFLMYKRIPSFHLNVLFTLFTQLLNNSLRVISQHFPNYSRYWMKAPLINFGLITQHSRYIVQNPDGFFISRVIFCFCFYSFDGKNKSLCYAKVSLVALEGRKRTFHIIYCTPWNLSFFGCRNSISRLDH